MKLHFKGFDLKEKKKKYTLQTQAELIHIIHHGYHWKCVAVQLIN